MIVAKTRAELAEALKGVPRKDIKLVPTMGALHEGHLSLVRAAKDYDSAVPIPQKGGREADGVVIVSIFVNPTQFNDPADLRNYPRTPERDLAMLETEGVDVVFMPAVDEVYPEPDTRVFDFGNLDKVMEGATRPGHFNGVAQVVSRLFELVGPAVAFFGQKDFQQKAIVKEMVRQLGMDVRIEECPTVREADGLAMSSRNALLTPAHRAAAPDIYRALRLGTEKAGMMPRPGLEKFITEEMERSGLLKTIYCNITDNRIYVAVQAGNVRLIDNILMDN